MPLSREYPYAGHRITMSTSIMTRSIEPGDRVYVRGRYHVFLVLDVHQGKALVEDSDAWVRHKWVALDACQLADGPDLWQLLLSCRDGAASEVLLARRPVGFGSLKFRRRTACMLRSAGTDARREGRRCFGRSDRSRLIRGNAILRRARG
jgi:hypothetical protein